MLLRTLAVLTIFFEATVCQDAKEGSHHITLRDKEFVGPDKRLEELLRRRMAASPATLADLTPREPPLPHPAPSKGRERSAPPAPSRRQHASWWWQGTQLAGIGALQTLKGVGWISGVVAGATVDHILKPIHSYTVQPMKDYIRFAIGAGRWFKNYDAEDLKPRILQFQEHLILLAAERIKSARPIFQRLEQDERYRVACIFNKLKYWSQRMIQAHESVKRKGGARPNRFQVHYYQRIHRMQIDVSYTVEFLYHIHKLYLTKVQVKDRVTARDKDMIKLLTKMKEHMHGSNLSPSESKFYQSMMDSMGD